MKDIQYKMHVSIFYTDHGYCKEMARENMSCVFISCKFSSHRLIMGKEEIDNFFCLIGDIWNFFYRNVY